jgi:NTP pyrophosphatase (non-canonical NTP hydrolase)
MLISKQDALNKKQKWYFTGVSCANNHIDKRYVKTGVCYACKREHHRKDRQIHNLKRNKKAREYVKERKLQGKIKKSFWHKKNPEKRRLILKRYREKNLERLRLRRRLEEREKRRCPQYRVHRAISKQIWSFMKGLKGGKKWESVVGYSFEDLKKHLQGQFTPEMSWENYGSFWEIDHIIPKKNFKENEDISVIWNLKNLQPLEVNLNRSKGNKNNKRRIDVKIDYLNQQLATENNDYESISGRLKDIDIIRLLHASMGMSTESSEFVDTVKKTIFYGKSLDKVNLIEEMGDILYYIAMACNVLGTDFETVMERNIAKLKARYPEKFTEELAENRDLEKERAILEGKGNL